MKVEKQSRLLDLLIPSHIVAFGKVSDGEYEECEVVAIRLAKRSTHSLFACHYISLVYLFPSAIVKIFVE